MALNENMNEEQDMPVPQEPVQQQEEVTLPQPLTKEEEEKILAGEIPEFVEEVAKGVEDALDAQAQEPEPQVQEPYYKDWLREFERTPPLVEETYYREGLPFRRFTNDDVDMLQRVVLDRINSPGAVPGEPEPQVQEPRMGPETIFFNDRGAMRYVLPSKEEPVVDYDFSDPQSKVGVLFNKGYLDDMVNSQGRVVGSNSVVGELIKYDRQLAEERGIPFSFRKAYLGSMGDLYIDAMKRIGKDVSKLNRNSLRFQMYAASNEGAREIDKALTFVYYHDKFNGEIPNNIKNKLELPEGKGRLSSQYIGLKDQDYENMGPLGKIVYNTAVAGKTMADTAIPFFEDFTGEINPGVAPVGELVGVIAGYMVPFSAASKLMKAKNILSADKYGKIPGWAVRSAVAGAAADTYVFESNEGTLGNMFAESDSVLINNAFTTALAIDIDDPEWLAKTKIALEGVVLGGMLDATASKLRQLKLGERVPGFFNKMKARLGEDGLPKTSGLTPELDKAILELKKQRQSLQEDADKIANKLDELPDFDSGYFAETLRAKYREISDNILELATVEDVLEGKYVGKEKLAGLAKTTTKRVDETLSPPKEEVVPDGPASPAEPQPASSAEDPSWEPQGADLLITRLRKKIEELKEGKGTVEGAAKSEKVITDRKLFGEIDRAFEKSVKQLDAPRVEFDFQMLLKETDDLKRKELLGQMAIPELVEAARMMYRANPSLQNQTRLALTFDILEEASMPLNKKRKRKLIPADIKTNLEILSNISNKSDLELEEILINRNRSNKAQPETIEKQIAKHGIEKATKKLASGRKVRGIADILVDIRTNNLLYSLGVPALATASGILMKGVRSLEYGVGRGVQPLVRRVSKPSVKEELVEATFNRIKDLEDGIYNAADDAEQLKLENELKKYRLQLRNLDRTEGRVKDEIKILKKIEAETNDETRKKLLAEAEKMGLVVEDPSIREEAKRLWQEVDNLRVRGEGQEQIDEAVRLANEQTKSVPKENPTRISDLEEELKAIKDPTYRRVDTTAEQIDNIFYTLSGGKIQLAGRSPEPKDLWDLITGLLSASAPSRIDPAIGTKSEALLGAGLKAGYDPKIDTVLGIDPAGLGRLGKWAQGIENPVMRTLWTTLVSTLEFIPRKALATIDESLKTRDFIREFMMRLDENITGLQVVTGGTGVRSLDQQELVKEIQEAFFSVLGEKGDAIDFVDAIMVRLREAKKAKEAIVPEVTPQLEQDLVLLEKLSQLEDLPKTVKESIDKTLDEAVKVTKNGRLGAEVESDVRKVIEKTVEEAQQFARETTITQDVPPMMQRLIKGIQRYAPLRGIAPFARATTNVAAMAVARTPLSFMIRKERQALSGALGEVEQARSAGKILVGSSLIYTGYRLTDTDGDAEGVRLEVVDKGSWKEFNLVIPMSGQDFEDLLRASALRWYTNNSEIIARELKREGLPHTVENAVEYIIDNLPEWEDRAGSVKIDFSRLGPFNTLIQAGMAAKDLATKTPWEYMTEKEEENSPLMDIVTQTFDFINNQGYLSAATDFFKMFDNPEYAATAFVAGWGADLISPGKGLLSTAGEPFQRDFRPSREEESVFQQKMFNQLGTKLLGKILGEDYTLMKKRDFLGRVIDAPDRAFRLVGKKYDVDLITSEMEELGFSKRVPRPTSVTKFSDIDLRKFKLKPSLMTKKEKEDFDKALVARDGQNAYEDFLIMSGSISVAMNRYDLVKDSATKGLQQYFKSQEYKTLKDIILSLDEDYTPAEQLEAEAAYEEIRKNINEWTARGRNKAASIIYNYAHLYVNEDGESLQEFQDARTNATRQAEFEVNKIQRRQGLDALRPGGNK